ncbi:MAG: TIM barrel protein, partial [Chloroflexota bacterium]|nr:TIM barrel protein [Chloroflexota bacterium]
CNVALDTEFLALHGQLEAVFTAKDIWQQNRVRHVHIKDFDHQSFASDGSRQYLHPGEGIIDFERFFQGLKQHGFDGSISLEASAIDTQGQVHIGRLQSSLQRIRCMMEA